jgi:hypothetical protein
MPVFRAKVFARDSSVRSLFNSYALFNRDRPKTVTPLMNRWRLNPKADSKRIHGAEMLCRLGHGLKCLSHCLTVRHTLRFCKALPYSSDRRDT